MVELDGAVAVVTGGSYGIGRATAIALAREGAGVVVADIFDDEGANTVGEIERHGGRGLFVHTDVGSRSSVEALVQRAVSWQGHCDLVLSNAAISGLGAPHEFSPEDWEATLAVNLFGAIWASRSVLPHMLERGSGHLAFVASGWGFTGSADNAPYSVSKFALVGLAESLAVYLKGTGVSVSLVVPGAVGGEHADTMRIAGAGRMTDEEVQQIKADRRAMTAGWPTPQSMAETIVAGLRAGLYYIIQEGPGHEDWLARQMREKWNDPEVEIRADD